MVSEKDGSHHAVKAPPLITVKTKLAGTRFRLLTAAADYCGVRSWEVEVLPLTVVPLDDVGRLPVFMVNLENDAMTVRLATAMPPNQNSITDSCEHYASDPQPHHPSV
jgi:hypothetical protein